MAYETLQERVQYALSLDKELTQSGLARHCGVSRASVNGWTNGSTQAIDGKYLTMAADYLRVTPHWLSTGLGPIHPTGSLYRVSVGLDENISFRPPPHTVNLSSGVVQIPLLDRKTSGMHKEYLTGQIKPTETLPYHDATGTTFAYRVDDDVMEPDFKSGTIAYIETATPAQHGDVVLVMHGQDSILRKLIIDGDLQYLDTMNQRLPPRPLTGQIIGWVSGEYRPRRSM